MFKHWFCQTNKLLCINGSSTMNRIAECCCGQLTIEVLGDPEMHGVCHCNNCKKRTGSAFGMSSYFDKSQIVKTSGEANCFSFHNTEKNHDQKRHFCTVCGTTLFWSVSTMPKLTGIAGGCFVKSPLSEPTYSANQANICSWLGLPRQWQQDA